jgi:hypothetical protein
VASNRKQSDGGCFGALIAAAIVLGLIVMGVTAVGDLLGLTPSVSEITDRPDGWVTRHYQGVVGGYILTVLFLALVAAALWLAIRALSEVPQQADAAKYWLARVGWAGAVLLVAILVLPIGKREDVQGNVPRVVGMSAAEADRALDDANLDASYREVPLDDELCKIVQQHPRPGADVEEFSDINLRCAVRIPRVVGRKARAAESKLSDRGFDVRLVNEPHDFDLSRCRVRRQAQTGAAPPDSKIVLRLRCRKPPPPPEPEPALPSFEEPVPAANCDPNYDRCVPPYPPDVDCADVGGSVAVIGDDPHGLDSDADGIGCE